jgi:hypothetical protein
MSTESNEAFVAGSIKHAVSEITVNGCKRYEEKDFFPKT